MVFDVEVLVTPRERVLDPQGKAIEKSLYRLGYGGVKDVRVGRVVRFQLEAADKNAAREAVKEMCGDILSNELVETCKITAEAAVI